MATLRILPPQADIFESQAAVLVVPVNCIGSLGAGLAKAFSLTLPHFVRAYQSDCRSGIYNPGDACLYKAPPIKNTPHIICAATKGDWREPSRVQWVQDCADDIRRLVLYHKLPSIGIPMLGAGCGKLRQDDVRPLLERVGLEMVAAGVDVEVFEHRDTRRPRQGRRG